MNEIPTKISAEFSERAGSAVYPEYSLDINAVISLSARIDERRMARAVRLLLDAEPILGCRFVERWFRPYWRRYDDLDSLNFFEVRNSSHPDSDVRRFLETAPNLPVWVLVLRSKSDVLCIKFDHRIVDGSAMATAIYALAGIYNRLTHEPRYVPTPNVNASRSIRQIAAGFTFREKWRFSRVFFDSVRRRKNLGQWQYPIPAAGDRELDYSIWRLESDRLASISKYALRQRASVNQVLLAGFHLAALGVLGHSSDLPLPVRTTVDLRRYLRSRRPPGLCNLSGQSLVAIDSHAGTSLDAVVRQIRDQMHLQRKEYLGLIVSTFPYQGLPLRYLIDLIPFWYLKRMGRRAIEANRQRLESRAAGDSFRGILLLSNAGKLDANPFLFEGTEMTHAFGTTGIVKNPGVLGIVVSGFKDSLTLCLGVGPSSLINTISERMMQILPR